MLKKLNVKIAFLVILSGFNQPLMAANPTPRIIGGTVAANHAYPFVVALEYSSDNFQFCGGSLITPNKVLTAAHCVDTSEPVHVRVGTNNKLTDLGEVIKVTAQTKHSKFNSITLDYDVAVLTLAKSVILNDSKNLINLPEACSSLVCITGLTNPGTILRAIGWGSTLADGNNASDNLLQVDLPIIDNTICNTALLDNITHRMICAGPNQGGRDACNGDSGGPLFAYFPGARAGLQAGIVSWGEGSCAQANKYGVYTRISNADIRTFIKQQTGR